MHSNHISLDGNNNIVIQDAQGSHIYVNSDEGVRQLLAEQGDQIKQILEHLQAQPEPVLQQFAQKIYQIGQIENAHFHIYGERSIKKHLTPPPFIPELFLGREVDLTTVHTKLFRGDNLLLLVNGQGGIGKTTLAAKYWEKYQDQYSHVAWVFAGNSLLDALLSLAQALELSFPEALPNIERLPLLLKALSNLNKPCLLVIDNANDLEDLENNYLALRSCSNFHLLLTTRITEFEQAAFHQIQPLESKVAIDLFQTHYPKYQASEQPLMEQILGAVGHNTLVIELLAKNLRNLNKLREQYSLADLLQDLQGKGLLALGKSAPVKVGYQASGLALRQETPEAIIAAMYDLGALSAGEKQLMSVFAVLPAERIEFGVLEELLSEKEDLGLYLSMLAQRGWLDFEEKGSSFKVSPVVQEIVMKKNIDLRKDCQNLIITLIKKLEQDPSTGHFEQVNYNQAYLFSQYGESVLNCFFKADNDLSDLCEIIGSYHFTMGNLLKAKLFCEKDIQLNSELLKRNSNSFTQKKGLASSFERLGMTLYELGQIEESLNYLEKCRQLREDVYDSFHHDSEGKHLLACTYEKFGEIYFKLSNLDKALHYFKLYNRLEYELFENLKENIEFKKCLALSHEKLGNTYLSLGNLTKAQSYFEIEARLFEELNESLPDKVAFIHGLAVSHNYLGNCYFLMDDLENALSKYIYFNDLMKKLYYSHPKNNKFKHNLAISYEKVGEIYMELNQFDNAKQFFIEDISLRKELSDESPSNFIYKHSLAIANSKFADFFLKQEEYEQALEFMEQDIMLCKDLLESFPNNIELKNSLSISYSKKGQICMEKGDIENALLFFEKDIQLTSELHIDFPQNIDFKNNLAISHFTMANIFKNLKNQERAILHFQAAEKLWVELVQAAPGYAQFQHYLELVRQFLS